MALCLYKSKNGQINLKAMKYFKFKKKIENLKTYTISISILHQIGYLQSFIIKYLEKCQYCYNFNISIIQTKKPGDNKATDIYGL